MTPQRRSMGGGGDHAAHHAHHAAPHPGLPPGPEPVMFHGHSPHAEGWETTVAVHYSLAVILILAIQIWQPANGIDAWAAQEAAARLRLKEEHGWTDDMFEFGVHYQNMDEADIQSQWDRFSTRAVVMNEDDDDEDEDDDDDE
jgi:ESSS subunit of NADH:ubiquinone oxidoreductase (complex I)